MTTQRLTLDRVLRLIDTTIETLDARLNGHSEQVAYIVYKIAQELGVTDKNELKILCKTAFLHDVGCYKTEDQVNLLTFEAKTPYPHAAYGYAFLKYFYSEDIDPLIVKWHHTPWHIARKYPDEIPEHATLLHLADRIAVTALKQHMDFSVLKNASGTLFCPEHVDAFFRANEKQQIVQRLKTGLYRAELRTFFSQFILSQDQVLNFARMMAYALDFHSNTSVLHSILVTGIAKKLAELFDMTEAERRDITIAASLHDIGKLVIPTSILEKPGKLTSNEFEIMKYHAIAGYDILSSLGVDNIRDIATLHHETLDGRGYPFGLKAEELSFSSKLLSVVDISSALLARRSYKEAFPKEEVFFILRKMADTGKIEKEIVEMFCLHFDEIYAATLADVLPAQQTYNDLASSYENELAHLMSVG